jgi:outer membrane protein
LFLEKKEFFTMKFSFYVVGMLLVVQYVPLLASGRTITLDQARQIALEANVSVVQAGNNVEAARSDVTAAYGQYLPTLSLSGGWNRYQNDRPGTDPFVLGGILIPGTSGLSVEDNYQTNLSLQYTIFDGFSREATLNQATSNATATEHELMRTRQATVFQVETSYLNLFRLQQLVRVSEENLKRDRRQLERITESNRVGALSLADVYRQQSQVAADELAVITAQNDYDKAKADLVALIGMDMVEDVEFTDPAVEALFVGSETEAEKGAHPDFTAAVGRALENRPDYLSAKERLSSSSSAVQSARSGYFPSVTVGAGYGISGNEFSQISENKNLSWGVNFRWNIFDGFTTNQLLENAAAQERNASVALQQAERDIAVEVKKALLDLEAARKQFDVSQKGLISAREDRRIQEERYNLGAGTLLDLLIANAGYVTAEANKVNATYAYIVAQRNLEYVVGERKY